MTYVCFALANVRYIPTRIPPVATLSALVRKAAESDLGADPYKLSVRFGWLAYFQHDY